VQEALGGTKEGGPTQRESIFLAHFPALTTARNYDLSHLFIMYQYQYQSVAIHFNAHCHQIAYGVYRSKHRFSPPPLGEANLFAAGFDTR
jgi:hypothetical protein